MTGSAKQSSPNRRNFWIASSLPLLAMTIEFDKYHTTRLIIIDASVTIEQ